MENKYISKISIDEISDFVPHRNRIAKILLERNIDPTSIDEKFLKEELLISNKEEWFKILRNECEPKLFNNDIIHDERGYRLDDRNGIKVGQVYKIMWWLNIDFCDLYENW
jgi:hypothetical protein